MSDKTVLLRLTGWAWDRPGVGGSDADFSTGDVVEARRDEEDGAYQLRYGGEWVDSWAWVVRGDIFGAEFAAEQVFE